jgi:hypothetical protein
MSLQNTEFLVQKILIVLSYFVSIPILGYFRSWVNARLGDDTGEQLGFSTLNPMQHISFFWIFILLIIPDIQFGFGQYIPINPNAIVGKWRRLKVMAAYFSDVLFGIFLALISLLLCVIIFRQSPLSLFINFGVFQLASSYAPLEACSSLSIVVGLFLIRFAVFNTMLAAFSMIVNFFYMVFLSYFLSRNNFPGYADWILFLAPLFLLLFFQSIICVGILNFILLLSTAVSYGIGIL